MDGIAYIHINAYMHIDKVEAITSICGKYVGSANIYSNIYSVSIFMCNWSQNTISQHLLGNTREHINTIINVKHWIWDGTQPWQHISDFLSAVTMVPWCFSIYLLASNSSVCVCVIYVGFWIIILIFRKFVYLHTCEVCNHDVSLCSKFNTKFLALHLCA